MPFRIDKHVLELHVAMDDAVRVDVGEALGEVRIPDGGLLLGNGTSLAQVLERAGTSVRREHEVHDEIRHALRGIDGEVEDADDARVVQSGEELAFGEEALAEEGVRGALASEDLEGIADAEVAMFDLVDGAHAALPQQADHAVGSDLISALHFRPLYHKSPKANGVRPTVPTHYGLTIQGTLVSVFVGIAFNRSNWRDSLARS